MKIKLQKTYGNFCIDSFTKKRELSRRTIELKQQIGFASAVSSKERDLHWRGNMVAHCRFEMFGHLLVRETLRKTLFSRFGICFFFSSRNFLECLANLSSVCEFLIKKI